MMAAILTGGQELLRSQERQRLLSELLDAVKQCQIRFGGRSELATESDNHISVLCKCLESVFCHGLRSKPNCKTGGHFEQVTSLFKNSQGPLCFWHYVREHLTKHELDRYLSLKKVATDVGRGRAWLRSSLNERCLDKYFHMLLSNPTEAGVFYHDWSLLMDQELNSTLPNMAAGLSSILFAIAIDDARFNFTSGTIDYTTLSKSEPVLAVPIEDLQQRRRRKAPAQIISFDGDLDYGGSSPDSSSAPATCLSSSVQSASFLCSPPDTRSFEYPETGKPALQNSASPSSNDSSFHDFEPHSKTESTLRQQESTESRTTLTPVSDSNVGELILISAEELPQDVILAPPDLDDLKIDDLVISEPAKPEEIRLILNVLEQLKETHTGLKTKLQATLKLQKDEREKLHNRLQALTRENEMLKHQLKKYVGAVQMLHREGGSAHEALASLEACKESREREEAMQYELKLVQVAEMHGELMEFNERLHKLILSKEDVIRRLERELTDLRGPLPSSQLWDDDVMAVPEALVNIWIPSAFLTGGSADVHHVYQVYVKIRDIEWNIYRRYSQFYSLHKTIRKTYSIVATLDFPPKKTIGNKDLQFVEDRRLRLQRYLRQAVDVICRARSDLTDPASLVSIIPFFGQNANKEDGKSKNQKKKGRSNQHFDPSQYNGL